MTTERTCTTCTHHATLYMLPCTNCIDHNLYAPMDALKPPTNPQKMILDLCGPVTMVSGFDCQELIKKAMKTGYIKALECTGTRYTNADERIIEQWCEGEGK